VRIGWICFASLTEISVDAHRASVTITPNARWRLQGIVRAEIAKNAFMADLARIRSSIRRTWYLFIHCTHCNRVAKESFGRIPDQDCVDGVGKAKMPQNI
jgi:hypothetical protein